MREIRGAAMNLQQARRKTYLARARAWKATVEQTVHPESFDGTLEMWHKQIKGAVEYEEMRRDNLRYAKEALL